MTLALFDLDNTLLSGDSDYEWGNFLVRKKLVDKDHYKQANQKFYQDYIEGKLDIYEFSAFTFDILTRLSHQALDQLHQEFMVEVILPLISDKARALVEKHREQHHTLVIITATNQFITAPIATELGIPHLIATQAKIIDGRYTTEIEGIPCFQAGKVQRLSAWMSEHNENLKGSYFYSDSHNDAPLMYQVDHAIAVDPDEKLSSLADQENWKKISLRENITK